MFCWLIMLRGGIVKAPFRGKQPKRFAPNRFFTKEVTP
jgi:hypothetical protein